MPISVSDSVVAPLSPGDTVTKLAIKQSHGNFSGLTWTGNNSSVYLAQSLLLPGNADQYTNPDDAGDARLEVGDWVQGLPGVNNSSAVRAALNDLLGVEITIPAWDQSRDTGSGLDYHVTGFERIALTAYKLGGNGWISFTYLGPGRCYNQPPVAEDQSYTVDEDASVGLTLAATDEDGDPLTYEIVQGPSHGQLSGSAPGLVYTPNPDFDGQDVFTYVANDGFDDSNIAQVAIDVLPVNDPPVAFNQQLEVDEDQSVAVVLTGHDVEGDALSYRLVSQPDQGQLSGEAPNLVYTPNPDYSGVDQFSFVVNDGALDSASAIVIITSNPVNDPPVVDDATFQTLEDEPLDIVLEGTDIDSATLSFRVVTQPAHGVITRVQGSTFRYVPNTGYFGPDTFEYVANDGFLDSNIGTVSIEVLEKDKPPVITTTPPVFTVEGAAYSYDADAVDPNTVDELTFSLLAGPDGMTMDTGTGLIDWLVGPQYVSGLRGPNHFCFATSFDEQARSLELVVLNETASGVSFPAQSLDALVAATDDSLNTSSVGSEANPNVYGLLSFSEFTDAVLVGGDRLYPADAFPAASAQLSASPEAPSDGVAAVEEVLAGYGLSSTNATHLLLASDGSPAATQQTVDQLRSSLATANARLSVIADVEFECANGDSAWGVDANNRGYLADSGDIAYCEDPQLASGESAVVETYVELALASGGSVWNLERLVSAPDAFVTVLASYLVGETVNTFSVEQSDLVVDNLRIESDGQDPTLNLTVANRGLADIPEPVSVRVQGVSGGARTTLGQFPVTSLGAGEAVLLELPLPDIEQYEAIAASVSALTRDKECVVDNNELVAPRISLEVRDLTDLTDRQDYLLNVHEANEQPFFITSPATTAFIGQEYVYHVIADDPDRGDLWRYALLESPDGMQVNPETGRITWTPEGDDAGTVTVTIEVSDLAGADARQTFELAVGYENQAPVIVSVPIDSAQLGQDYFYDVNAQDADGDALAYELLEAPDGAVIDAATGMIRWPALELGGFEFTVQVSDGRGGAATQVFTRTVHANGYLARSQRGSDYVAQVCLRRK